MIVNHPKSLPNGNPTGLTGRAYRQAYQKIKRSRLAVRHNRGRAGGTNQDIN